jgi:dipeptidyl aminopeptidase/acylaminoacyl peptidase
MLPPTPEEDDDRSGKLGNRYPQTIYTYTRRPSLKQYPRQARNLRVKFEVDENQHISSITVEAASPSTAFTSKESWRDLWWNRTDLMQIWKREQSACDFYRQSSDESILIKCDKSLPDAEAPAPRMC